jgi:hypothetical protein
MRESFHTSSHSSYDFQISPLDKMEVIKAYEVILRNQGKTIFILYAIGILPVSDSRIYNLVFKVFKKCEISLMNAPSSNP